MSYAVLGARTALTHLGLTKHANIFDQAYAAAQKAPGVGAYKPLTMPAKAYLASAAFPLGMGAVAGGAMYALHPGAVQAAREEGLSDEEIDEQVGTRGGQTALAAGLSAASGLPLAFDVHGPKRRALDVYNELAKNVHNQGTSDIGAAFAEALRQQTGKKDRHLMGMLHPDQRAAHGGSVPAHVLDDAFNALGNRTRAGAAGAAGHAGPTIGGFPAHPQLAKWREALDKLFKRVI